MERKALSSVVGNILIIMFIVIAAGIFLSVYLRSVRNVADRDLPLCVGIDLKMLWCVGFLNGYTLPSGYTLSGNGLYFVVERFPGGGEIRDLRFRIIDNEGKSRSERPVNFTIPGVKITTEYRKLVEHSTIEAVLLPYSLTPQGDGIPCEVSVSAVVGESNTICAPAREPIKCLFFDPGVPGVSQPQVVQMPLCS